MEMVICFCYMVKYGNPGDSVIAQLFSIGVSFYVPDYANTIPISKYGSYFRLSEISMSWQHAAKIAVFQGFGQYLCLN